MKLQVTQANLSRALNTVARIANSRGSLPVLANILLKTENNRLKLVATNLDIAISQFVGTKIESEGSITVPARLTQEFVSNLPDGTVSLELELNKLHIRAEKYNSTINGIAADDFPVMPQVGNKASWKLPAAELKKALSKTVFSASNDDSRPILTGVYFNTSDGQISIAATDSYRLAESKLTTSKTSVDFLLPATAASELLRVIDDSTEDVVIDHDEQQVQFTSGDTTLVARLIEGTYPDYQKLIPSKFSTVAKLSRTEFLNIAKVSALFARESAGSITLNVSKDDSKVSINAVASQLGENTAEAEASVSADGEVTLNSRYLIEALGAYEAADIEFCFNGKLEPCVLRSPEQKDYLHLIMPLRS